MAASRAGVPNTPVGGVSEAGLDFLRLAGVRSWNVVLRDSCHVFVTRLGDECDLHALPRGVKSGEGRVWHLLDPSPDELGAITREALAWAGR